MRLFVFSLILALVIPLSAQPDTDIYLLPVLKRDSLDWELGEARNITPRKGYDNQPYFTLDGASMLFVSADEKGQTDVFRYRLSTRSIERLTDTRSRSEYSPTPTPNGKGFSAVVVEEDSAQRLWYFDFGDDKGQVLMDKITDVGYHAWYHKKKLGMFIIGETLSLQTTHVKRQKARIQSEKIGRAIQPLPGEKSGLSYVSKAKPDWRIMAWDARTKKSTLIAPTLDGAEDYAWTPEGNLLMGKGGVLYIFHPEGGEGWQPIGDLGVGDFYRLAMSPDGRWLAVVSYAGEKP